MISGYDLSEDSVIADPNIDIITAPTPTHIIL
jgi:hypothetical protein